MINIFQKIKSFFYNSKKNEENTDQEINNNFCDILISLDKDLNTGIFLYFKDKNYEPMSETEYSLICAEFLSNAFTNKVIDNILDILNKDIISNQNFSLIKKIDILCQYQQNIQLENSFIKPSQVFLSQNIKNNNE